MDNSYKMKIKKVGNKIFKLIKNSNENEELNSNKKEMQKQLIEIFKEMKM